MGYAGRRRTGACPRASSADRRFCGPRLFGLVAGRSNSCPRIGGHSHAGDPAERDRRPARNVRFVHRRSLRLIHCGSIPQGGTNPPGG